MTRTITSSTDLVTALEDALAVANLALDLADGLIAVGACQRAQACWYLLLTGYTRGRSWSTDPVGILAWVTQTAVASVKAGLPDVDVEELVAAMATYPYVAPEATADGA